MRHDRVARIVLSIVLSSAPCLGASAAAAASTASIEEGDYTFFQLLRNLVSPVKADRPVRPEQRHGPLPLLANPPGFDDGFRPGTYRAWQTVRLDPGTGAVCGNGSPYKFFVNRVANTSNTLIYFEGGGACWDYESCSGRLGLLGARNPDGIPDDYMKLANPGASLASPFVFRLHPYSRVKTQDWNLVYVPYCTGDIYTGDKVAVYEDPTGREPQLVWHHNGLRNVRAVVAWLKDNLPRPGQLVQTGCSAGGVGSIANYHHVRRDLDPARGFLLNDSGPLFPTDAAGDPGEYPSAPLHNRIRTAWALDRGMYALYGRELPLFSAANVGSLNRALAVRWPADRMGHVHFWRDLDFSRYSYYRFFPDLHLEPDPRVVDGRLLARWEKDTQRLYTELAGIENVGVYLPQFRDVNKSHCATIIDFRNGDIQERGLELDDFIASVLDGSGTVLDATETDRRADDDKPFNLFYWLFRKLVG